MKNRRVRIIALFLLLMCCMPRSPEAQTTSTVVRIGEWLISELSSYALGKALDRSLESRNLSELFNRKEALQQKGASDDPQLTKAELRSLESQMRIVFRLYKNKISPQEIEPLKAEITANNQLLLAALADHEERIQALELLNKLTGLWECAGRHRWLKILPDGTIFNCYIGRRYYYTCSGEIKFGGAIDWQAGDWAGYCIDFRTAYRNGANLALSRGDRTLLCARTNSAMPDLCNAPF